MKVLFVGFSPFAAHPVNPSEMVVKDFAKGNSKGIVLPISYKRAKEEFIKAYEEYNPDHVLIFNLSPYTHRPLLEQYAYNNMNAPIPDNDGVSKTNEPIIEDGPKSIMSHLNPSCIEQYLASKGIKTSLGLDPGGFICNEIYYLSLTRNKNSLLIHIPVESDMNRQEINEGIESIIEYLEGMN